MVQNFPLKRDPTNPGVRGIAARFEALAAASPPPPCPINNKSKPKISFDKVSLRPSDHQKTQNGPVAKAPKESDVSLTTMSNAMSNGMHKDVQPTAVQETTNDYTVEVVSLDEPVEPVSTMEGDQQNGNEKVIGGPEVAPSEKEDQEQKLEVVLGLVGEIAMEEQAFQEEQPPCNTVDGIAVEKETVEEEPLPTVAPEDVDATKGEIGVEEDMVQKEPAQSATVENDGEDLNAIPQQGAPVEQNIFASDTTSEAQHAVLEE